ncbi:hypothetical protein VCR29J2_680162 [Vibrio coralliirubri]|nr:hypothetical protein VCR29J2_680162 [Vibrio coralliirubri]
MLVYQKLKCLIFCLFREDAKALALVLFFAFLIHTKQLKKTCVNASPRVD